MYLWIMKEHKIYSLKIDLRNSSKDSDYAKSAQINVVFQVAYCLSKECDIAGIPEED